MALKITSNTLLTARSLSLDSRGVEFRESAFVGGVRRFAFRDITCVLLSPDNVLSFQVDDVVCSIPVKPDKPAHKNVIETLIQSVRANCPTL